MWNSVNYELKGPLEGFGLDTAVGWLTAVSALGSPSWARLVSWKSGEIRVAWSAGGHVRVSCASAEPRWEFPFGV